MFGIFDKIKEFFQEIFIGIIQSNLEAMFVDINDKVTFVSNEVGKTPQSFNGEVFSFIKNINDSVIIPIAGLIITAVLCIELIQTVMKRNNMHDGDSFELFKYVFKMAVAVYLVSHAFEFAMASFDVAQNLVSKAAGVINTSSNLSSSEFTSMIEALKEKDVGELIVIALETSIIKIDSEIDFLKEKQQHISHQQTNRTFTKLTREIVQENLKSIYVKNGEITEIEYVD